MNLALMILTALIAAWCFGALTAFITYRLMLVAGRNHDSAVERIRSEYLNRMRDLKRATEVSP